MGFELWIYELVIKIMYNIYVYIIIVCFMFDIVIDR